MPPPNRRKPIVNLTFDPALLAKIDAAAGKRNRSRWIEAACRRALDARVTAIPGFDGEEPTADV